MAANPSLHLQHAASPNEEDPVPELMLCDRLDVERMRKHSHVLGVAAQAMNKAFQAASAIEGMAFLVHANQVADSCEGRHFSPFVEGQLMTGIALIAEFLNNDLDRKADWINQNLPDTTEAK